MGAGNDPSRTDDGLEKGSTVSKAKIHPMDLGKDKHTLSLLALNPLANESMELFSGLLAPRQVETMC